ncbi:MAG: NAD(P)H-binding protein, partial [Myxococcota bacterium]
MSNETIFITGATGNVGNRVARILLEQGATVKVGVRSPAKAAKLAELGAEVVAFDYNDVPSMTEALSGSSRLFLLTPFIEFSAPLVERAVAAAKEAGVGFLLKMSAIGADPEGPFALARDHGSAEQVVQTASAWTIIRPSFFMSNAILYQAAAIKATGSFYGAAEEGQYSMISPEDIAAVAAAILQNPTAHQGQTYTLTGGQALTEAEVATAITQVSGRAVSYVNLTPEALGAALAEQGTP